MSKQQLTVIEFFEKFPTDEYCLEHVMKVRYGLQGECQNCHRETTYHRLSKRPAYSCNYCGHHVYPMAGTPFERTRTPLRKWFYAMYLFTTTRHGVPAKELQRQLGVTYKCAWRMAHEIRKYMGKVDGDNDLSGHVEADETYVGGKPRRKNTTKPGRGTQKQAVFGMVQRGGDLITRVVPSTGRKIIEPIIEEFVEDGSVMSTDEWVAYDNLAKMGYDHGRVNHGHEEWVNGSIHTNTIEGFWSHFKSSMKGTHRSISKKHMQNYLSEFEYRFNSRRDVSSAMFDRLIQAF